MKTFLPRVIKTQNRFANLAGHPLGYSSLNGAAPSLADVIDERNNLCDIQIIEIFSDEYSDFPQHTAVTDWEEIYRDIERADFHKTDEYPLVKGSTGAEFFDDRSVISIQL